MEPTFSYTVFAFGIIVGVVGLLLLGKLDRLIAKRVQRHVERKIQKEIEERTEFFKRLNIEETINQLENYANWEDN